MSVQPGPHPIDGVDMTTWIVTFDRQGACTSPETVETLLRSLTGREPPARVVLMSHGWNSDFADALGQYRAFLASFERVLALQPPTSKGETVFVGVAWPSVWFPMEPTPALAGGDPREQARENLLDEVAGRFATPADAARAGVLLRKDDLDAAEASEAARLLAPLLDGRGTAETTAVEPAPTWQDVATAAQSIQQAEGRPSEPSAAGTFDPTRMGRARAAGGSVPLDPRSLLRLLSLHAMKDRAGRVGATGVASLLRSLLSTQVPVHLVGHSFGAKVVLSAICAPPAPATPVASALLLQPAISHLAFARTLPGGGEGGYVAALSPDRVTRPIHTTFSRSDFPLHDVFHLALRRAADLGEARVASAGGPPSRYAALGGYGPRGAGEALVDPIPSPGRPVRVDGRARIVAFDGSATSDLPGLEASPRIACHGCVANPHTAWLLHQQMFGS